MRLFISFTWSLKAFSIIYYRSNLASQNLGDFPPSQCKYLDGVPLPDSRAPATDSGAVTLDMPPRSSCPPVNSHRLPRPACPGPALQTLFARNPFAANFLTVLYFLYGLSTESFSVSWFEGLFDVLPVFNIWKRVAILTFKILMYLLLWNWKLMNVFVYFFWKLSIWATQLFEFLS